MSDLDNEPPPLKMPLGGWDPLGVRPAFGTYRGLIRLMLGHLELMGGGLRPFQQCRWREVRRLVFVCTGNICRSPYAEHQARALDIPTASFGLSTTTGRPADATALRVAAGRGVDLRAHRACDARDFQILDGDLLVAMEPRQGHLMLKQFPEHADCMSLLGLWSGPRRPHIHDPHRLSDAYFSRCFDIVDSAVNNIHRQLEDLRDRTG